MRVDGGFVDVGEFKILECGEWCFEHSGVAIMVMCEVPADATSLCPCREGPTTRVCEAAMLVHRDITRRVDVTFGE